MKGWQYTEAQQRAMGLIVAEQMRYAKRVAKVIKEQVPKKHRQVVVMAAQDPAIYVLSAVMDVDE